MAIVKNYVLGKSYRDGDLEDTIDWYEGLGLLSRNSDGSLSLPFQQF